MEKLLWDTYERVYDAVLLKTVPYQRMIQKTYEALTPQQGKSYLDAGCGTGNFLTMLLASQTNVKVVGVDFSSAMIKKARYKLKGNEQQITLYEHDLNEFLPYRDESFDGIVCINVLYALKKPEFALKELSRVLNGKGKLVLSTPQNNPKMSEVIKEHIAILRNEHPRLWRLFFWGYLAKVFFPAIILIIINQFIKGNKSYNFFSAEQLKSLLEVSGFRIHTMTSIYGGQNWFVVAFKK